MSLDKLTLHAQLVVINRNVTTLDASITEKVKHIEQLTAELERTRGARHYHGLIVQQTEAMIADIEKAEALPPTT